MKGVRYSAAQKQEVVDFVIAYNAANGRGGLSKAAEKFNISQISISTWLKSAGAASPKAAKKAAKVKTPKAPKAAKAPKAKKAAKGKRRSRYSDEQKKELIDFVVAYNEANGRGGANNASKKFKISPLTVITWLKAAGVKPPGKKVVKKATEKAVKKVAKKAGKKAAKKAGKKAKAAPTTAAAAPVAASGNMGSKLNALAALHSQIEKAEAALAADKAKFAALKAAL